MHEGTSSQVIFTLGTGGGHVCCDTFLEWCET